MNTLADNLYSLRKSRRLTQTKVADLIGVTLKSYSGYEKNMVVPNLLILIKLADLYSTSLDALVGREGYLEIKSEKSSSLDKDQVEIAINMKFNKFKEKIRREIFKELFNEEF